jgi:hypothetical protein
LFSGHIFKINTSSQLECRASPFFLFIFLEIRAEDISIFSRIYDHIFTLFFSVSIWRNSAFDAKVLSRNRVTTLKKIDMVFGVWTQAHRDPKTFDAFLKHIRYGLLKRVAARAAPLDMTIEDVPDRGVRVKINSLFYTSDNVYPIGKETRTPTGYFKRFLRHDDGSLTSTTRKGDVRWTETYVSESEDVLKLTRAWTDKDDVSRKDTLTFRRN